MCIIVAKPKNVPLPPMEHLKSSFEHNSHGAGVMFLRDGQSKVGLRKGYMSWKSFNKKLNRLELKQEDTIVYHFRLATSGYSDEGNCHPYIVSDKIRKLRQTRGDIDGLCFAHNGIIGDLNGKHKKMNDTQLFSKLILSDKSIYENLYESIGIQNLIEEYIGTDKLAFLSPNEGLLTIGSFQEEKGILYSNNTYKASRNDKFINDWHYGVDEYDTISQQCEMCNKMRDSSWLAELSSDLCHECFNDFNGLIDEKDMRVFEWMLEHNQRNPYSKPLLWKDKDQYLPYFDDDQMKMNLEEDKEISEEDEETNSWNSSFKNRNKWLSDN